VVSLEFDLSTRWPEVPPEVRELIDEYSHLDFMRMPPTIQQDVGFVTASGISDCAGFALLLRREGRARGIAIRLGFGLIISTPFSSVHCWNEVRVDDVWVPIDALIVGSMLRRGNLDPSRWTRYSSPGAILGRLADEITPTALHAGELAHMTFPTRVVPA
jgi:hypothetical protein